MEEIKVIQLKYFVCLHRMFRSIFCNRWNRFRQHSPPVVQYMDSSPLLCWKIHQYRMPQTLQNIPEWVLHNPIYNARATLVCPNLWVAAEISEFWLLPHYVTSIRLVYATVLLLFLLLLLLIPFLILFLCHSYGMCVPQLFYVNVSIFEKKLFLLLFFTILYLSGVIKNIF